MTWWCVSTVCLLLLIGLCGTAWAADGLDMVTLKDGSVLYGKVVEMYAGTLRIKTGFGAGDGVVTVKWEDVTGITLAQSAAFTMKEGSLIKGQAIESKDGTVRLKGEPMSVPVEVPLASVKAINVPPVRLSGNATLGISGASGNSEFKNFSGLFDLVARSEELRLSLMGRYIYGESEGQVNARNALGTMKLDVFVTKRFFWFVNAYFEQDTFQDLKLRTAIGSGPGYQLIDKGDLSWIFSEMTFYAEAGVSYFNEDFRDSTREDMSSVRGRWAVNFNWPIVSDRVILFHNHEGYPSLQDSRDFYIISNTGGTLRVNSRFIIKPQVTWRYNNRPAAGTSASDTIYLITFGFTL